MKSQEHNIKDLYIMTYIVTIISVLCVCSYLVSDSKTAKDISMCLLIAQGAIALAYVFLYLLEVIRYGYCIRNGKIVIHNDFHVSEYRIDELEYVCLTKGYKKVTRFGFNEVYRKYKIDNHKQNIALPWLTILTEPLYDFSYNTCNFNLKREMENKILYQFVIPEVVDFKMFVNNFNGKYYIPFEYYTQKQEYFEYLIKQFGINKNQITLLQIGRASCRERV